MWRAEGKWLPKTSRKSVSQSVFCGTSTYCVLNTVPPIEDDHGNSNSSHVKIFLPKKLLECLPKCSSLPKERHRWNTNEEIAAYLITFEKHEEWLTTSPKTRPQNGSMILYNRKKVKYRKDGYCWKKRKDGKTTREDHMKLKVQGVETDSSNHSHIPQPLQHPASSPRGQQGLVHPTTAAMSSPLATAATLFDLMYMKK
ncbi:calmodulin-binding transcription activator 1 isoform X22 [Homo sapiens]|uniref:calmodulin-binding transcription activator 1 isoform X22 n=1 Tax=Homo sapiens TaxID=9606 RepID=UPI0003EB0551|nr:calmodulin-binding transcription activator 1 isoform X22 [Homo sapiens]XP_054191417.1 calmodulin-binding transcription activator 1 isoform X22 [Homo sapiens]|eukprot:XP_016856269.1 calmodulin-binding transcription activator 1 isoform X17 [Homo sapiens]